MTAEQEDTQIVPQTAPEPGSSAIPPSGTAADAPFTAEAAAMYDDVMAFCLKRGCVLVTTLMTQFVQIPIDDLDR